MTVLQTIIIWCHCRGGNQSTLLVPDPPGPLSRSIKRLPFLHLSFTCGKVEVLFAQECLFVSLHFWSSALSTPTQHRLPLAYRTASLIQPTPRSTQTKAFVNVTWNYSIVCPMFPQPQYACCSQAQFSLLRRQLLIWEDVDQGLPAVQLHDSRDAVRVHLWNAAERLQSNSLDVQRRARGGHVAEHILVHVLSVVAELPQCNHGNVPHQGHVSRCGRVP